MTYCKACKKPIAFMATTKGKQMPVDADNLGRAEKHEDGSLALSTVGLVVTALRPAYRSHFQTCTKPKVFRRIGRMAKRA